MTSASILYTPRYRTPAPCALPNPGSAWHGLEEILPAIIRDFNIEPESALEFGVEGGFSAAAIGCYFARVTAVDFFIGDEHSGIKADPDALERETRAALAQWPKIEVVRADCFEWMKQPANVNLSWNLCHVDIVHSFEPTRRALRWACDHAELVIGHDTESFSDVKRAFVSVAAETGREFYNFPDHHGLGILTWRLIRD